MDAKERMAVIRAELTKITSCVGAAFDLLDDVEDGREAEYLANVLDKLKTHSSSAHHQAAHLIPNLQDI